MVVHLCNVVDTNETLIVLAISYYTQACSLPNIPGLHPVPSKSSGTKRSIPEETEGRNPKKETAAVKAWKRISDDEFNSLAGEVNGLQAGSHYFK